MAIICHTEQAGKGEHLAWFINKLYYKCLKIHISFNMKWFAE